MRSGIPTDYETYREIMHDLVHPIQGEGLDLETLKQLYSSKLVYLENLRAKCFAEINSKKNPGYFSMDDYSLILRAIQQTRGHLRTLILEAVCTSLRKAS